MRRADWSLAELSATTPTSENLTIPSLRLSVGDGAWSIKVSAALRRRLVFLRPCLVFSAESGSGPADPHLVELELFPPSSTHDIIRVQFRFPFPVRSGDRSDPFLYDILTLPHPCRTTTLSTRQY